MPTDTPGPALDQLRDDLAYAIDRSALRGRRRQAAHRILEQWGGLPYQVDIEELYQLFDVGSKRAARKTATAIKEAGIPLTYNARGGEVTLHFVESRLQPGERLHGTIGSTGRLSGRLEGFVEIDPDAGTIAGTIEVSIGTVNGRSYGPYRIQLGEDHSRDHNEDHSRDHNEAAPDQAGTINTDIYGPTPHETNGEQAPASPILQETSHQNAPNALYTKSEDEGRDHKAGELRTPEEEATAEDQNTAELGTLSANDSHSLLVSKLDLDLTNTGDQDPNLLTAAHQPGSTLYADTRLLTPPRTKAESIAAFGILKSIGIDPKSAKSFSEKFSLETIRRAVYTYQHGPSATEFYSPGIVKHWLDNIGSFSFEDLPADYLTKHELGRLFRTPEEETELAAKRQKAEKEAARHAAAEKEIRARERTIEREKAQKAEERRKRREEMLQGQGSEEAAEAWQALVEHLASEAEQPGPYGTYYRPIEGSDLIKAIQDDAGSTWTIAIRDPRETDQTARMANLYRRELRLLGFEVSAINFQ